MVSRLRQLLHRTMLRAETWILVPRKEAPLSIFSWQVFMLLCYQWHSWGWKKLWRPATLHCALRYFWNIVFHLSTRPPNFRFFGHQPVCPLHILQQQSDATEKKRFTLLFSEICSRSKLSRSADASDPGCGCRRRLIRGGGSSDYFLPALMILTQTLAFVACCWLRS